MGIRQATCALISFALAFAAVEAGACGPYGPSPGDIFCSQAPRGIQCPYTEIDGTRHVLKIEPYGRSARGDWLAMAENLPAPFGIGQGGRVACTYSSVSPSLLLSCVVQYEIERHEGQNVVTVPSAHTWVVNIAADFSKTTVFMPFTEKSQVPSSDPGDTRSRSYTIISGWGLPYGHLTCSIIP